MQLFRNSKLRNPKSINLKSVFQLSPIFCVYNEDKEKCFSKCFLKSKRERWSLQKFTPTLPCTYPNLYPYSYFYSYPYIALLQPLVIRVRQYKSRDAFGCDSLFFKRTDTHTKKSILKNKSAFLKSGRNFGEQKWVV